MEKLVEIVLLSVLASCIGIENSNSKISNNNSDFSSANKKEEYYCEYCGKKFDSIRDMAINSCKKHPDGILAGSHKLYEGSTNKEWYECKYCGKRAKSIFDLTSNKCRYAPNEGWHRPRY